MQAIFKASPRFTAPGHQDKIYYAHRDPQTIESADSWVRDTALYRSSVKHGLIVEVREAKPRPVPSTVPALATNPALQGSPAVPIEGADKILGEVAQQGTDVVLGGAKSEQEPPKANGKKSKK